MKTKVVGSVISHKTYQIKKRALPELQTWHPYPLHWYLIFLHRRKDYPNLKKSLAAFSLQFHHPKHWGVV